MDLFDYTLLPPCLADFIIFRYDYRLVFDACLSSSNSFTIDAIGRSYYAC